MNDQETEALTWEDSYAIALALQAAHSDISLEEVSLKMIYFWTLDLPQFQDDPQFANDAILTDIYREWYEEVNTL